MELAGGVIAWANVDCAAARLTASINGALQCGTGVVGFAAGSAVIFHIENGLGADESAR